MTIPPSSNLRQSGPAGRVRDDLAGRRILMVEPSATLPLALQAVSGASVAIVQLDAVDAELLARTAPDVVLSPLMTSEYDILDLARVLRDCGYQGALRAYCPPLPNTRLVRAEVAQIWPGVDFDILEVPLKAD